MLKALVVCVITGWSQVTCRLLERLSGTIEACLCSKQWMKWWLSDTESECSELHYAHDVRWTSSRSKFPRQRVRFWRWRTRTHENDSSCTHACTHTYTNRRQFSLSIYTNFPMLCIFAGILLLFLWKTTCTWTNTQNKTGLKYQFQDFQKEG